MVDSVVFVVVIIVIFLYLIGLWYNEIIYLM